MLCWRACIVLLYCALLHLLRCTVSCGAASGLYLFPAGPCCPLLCPGGALRRWCLWLVLLLVLIHRPPLPPCALSCDAVPPCGPVLSCPVVFISVLCVFFCSGLL